MGSATHFAPPLVSTDSAAVVPAWEVTRRRVMRALRARRRYRYVKPEVRSTGESFHIVSPCCSRNVDPAGGSIDIAWLEFSGLRWRLHYRDHAAKRWKLFAEGPLARLLELLCDDPERRFWP